jgi:hypothetical protein
LEILFQFHAYSCSVPYLLMLLAVYYILISFLQLFHTAVCYTLISCLQLFLTFCPYAYSCVTFWSHAYSCLLYSSHMLLAVYYIPVTCLQLFIIFQSHASGCLLHSNHMLAVAYVMSSCSAVYLCQHSVHDRYHRVRGSYSSGFVSWCHVTDSRWTGLPLFDLEMWELLQFDFSVSVVGCDIREAHS